MPELGGIDAGLHLELLQRVDGGEKRISVEVDVGIGDAIQSVIVELAALAADREILAGAVASLAAGGCAAIRKTRIHVGAESDQLDEVPPVERQLHDSLVVDYCADIG